MGTSEEVRSEKQRQYRPNHAARVLHVHNSVHGHPPPSAGAAFSSPSSQPHPSAWPPQKHLDGELTRNQAMDVDPSYEEPSSPSPTHYGSNGSAFPFNDSASNQHQHQQSFGGLVATPITRFLTKQTFGFIPKPPTFPSLADRSTPSSPALPSSPLLAGDRKVPALRLPSLGTNSGSLPQSPLQSPPQPSFSLPTGETLSRLFGSSSIDGNSSNTPTPTRGSTVTLPPLKRSCPSPSTTPTLPPLTQQLSLDDICKPFRYQRSLSCPSDTMARAAAEEAACEAYSAPRVMLQFTDVPKNRLERSNSMDVSTVVAMREAHQRALYGEPERNSSSTGYDHHSRRYDHHSSVSTSNNINNSNVDYHGWLEPRNRHPLTSLAESAHAMQRLEQSHSPSTSESDSSTQAPNPFAVDADDFKREKKLCAFPQCASNAVTRGLCISHGGGRRCQRKGCTRGAQSKGLCVAHGGGRICRAKGCSNIQRSMGLCIRHGGGKRCSVAGCQKGVVRQDLCTAHGGKRKCRVEDCNKHVKKKGLCRSHANSVLGAGAMSPVHDEMDGDNSE